MVHRQGNRMGIFDDSNLRAMNFVPSDSLHARCPWCGGDLVLGRRKDTGAMALAHSVLTDKSRPQTEYIAGCDRFRDLVQADQAEFFRLLRTHHVRWTRLAE